MCPLTIGNRKYAQFTNAQMAQQMIFIKFIQKIAALILLQNNNGIF